MDTRQRHQIRATVSLTVHPPRLFWVTDDSVLEQPEFLEKAETALGIAGAHCAIQLRSSESAGRRIWDLAERLQGSARGAGAGLWVNDRLDVAMLVRADGVQLGRRSIPTDMARELLGRSCVIGRSVHSPGETTGAFESGADLAVLGSIYPTTSHPDRQPLGLAALREAAASGPVIAIGGITPDRVWPVMQAGAAGVAVRSGIWQAPSVSEAAGLYLEAITAAEAELGGAEPEDESLGLKGIDEDAG